MDVSKIEFSEDWFNSLIYVEFTKYLEMTMSNNQSQLVLVSAFRRQSKQIETLHPVALAQISIRRNCHMRLRIDKIVL